MRECNANERNAVVQVISYAYLIWNRSILGLELTQKAEKRGEVIGQYVQ